jgi:hypothetical protein
MSMTAEETDAVRFVASWYCRSIKRPFTLIEIMQQIEDGEYSAELMLQHLLLWVSKNTIQE